MILFATIYLLYLLHHVPFHRQVCDLPAEELAANDKSRRAIALQHQLIPRYMASWKVTFTSRLLEVTKGSPHCFYCLVSLLKGYHILVTLNVSKNWMPSCKVDRALGAASAKVELMRKLKLGMETTMPSALLEVDQKYCLYLPSINACAYSCYYYYYYCCCCCT